VAGHRVRRRSGAGRTGGLLDDVAPSESLSDSGILLEDMSLLLAGDGGHVFTTGAEAREIIVRTLAGSPVAVVDAGGPVHGIALSPDGATLYAILSDRLLAIDVSRYT
jgi:hypothetical protein